MSIYTKIIVEQLNKLFKQESDFPVWVNSKHVEAIMRVKYGTLDHLDRKTFNREIKLAVKDLRDLGCAQAEELANSYRIR